MTATDAVRAAPVPDQVPGRVDGRLLWAGGQRLAARHRPSGHDPDRCRDRRCGVPCPCRGRRLAEEAIRSGAARWHRRWTTRPDVRSIKILAGRGDTTVGFSVADGGVREARQRGGGAR